MHDTLHQRHSTGVISGDVDFILTQFHVPETQLDELPRWLRAELPQSDGKRHLDRLIDNARNRPRSRQPVGQSHTDHFFEQGFYGNPLYFIGKNGRAVELTTAPKLGRQLAALGIVPVRRRCWHRGIDHKGRMSYGLSIYWSRPSATDDSDWFGEEIQRNQSFFFEFCSSHSWNVTGMEYGGDPHSLVLIFHGMQFTPPFKRAHEIVLQNNALTLA